MIYDPGTAPGGAVRAGDILETFRARLPLLPQLSRKLGKVPLNLDSPYWVEDRNFDLGSHLHPVVLPKPGDRRQFHSVLARLHSHPIDLNRPPWHAYIIEGLGNIDGIPPGCFAILLKIHASASASASQIFEALHDLTPVPGNFYPQRYSTRKQNPGRLKMLGKTYINLYKRPSKFIKLLGHSLDAFRLPDEIRHRKIEKEEHDIREKTRFNREVSPQRVFGTLPISPSRIKAIRPAVPDCSVNAVALAAISGAMRLYLSDKKELPENSLVAGVAIGMCVENSPLEAGAPGVASMRISLRSDIEDPLTRLKIIHADALASATYARALSAGLLADLAAFVPSSIAALGLRIAATTGLATRKPAVHTVVTNASAPETPVYLCGARGQLWMGAGCPLDGVGLFHSLHSYNGAVTISFVCDRHMMPDPEFYARCLEQALCELEAAAAPERIAVHQGKAEVKPIRAQNTRTLSTVGPSRPAAREA
nr:putative wax ester/triacylglycerol synthase family O-acyltransferase [uncultured bacterium]